MKIVVKTLKGIRFEIQVKPDDSVADMKKNIETVLGASEYPAAEQTLIHKGKVLKDETTLEANNIAEKSSIAIMKRKPASTGSSTASIGHIAQGVLVLTANPSDPNAPGYYLPEGVQEQTQEPAAPEAAEPKGFNYFPEGLPNDGSLDFLRHTQQFRVLRLLVRSKPSMLKGILEAIEKRNPPLYKMIRENRDGFLRVLKDEPIEGEAGGNQMAQPREQLLDHQDDLLASSDDYEEEYLQISPEEYESIQRLEAMGFEHSLVVEVFLACNKNEELAANYLLEHNH